MTTFADLAAAVRASVVAVVSPTGRGSGYCALPNGVIVTSLDVVGYEREVQIVVDDGTTVPAAVVRANVALDVALLMPLEPIGLAPLELAEEPQLGDTVFLLGRAGFEPVYVQSSVAAKSRVCEGFGHLQIVEGHDEVLRGGPLLDATGRVLGLLVRPRRSPSAGDRNDYRWVSGLVLPNAAFEGGLASVEGTPDEVLELAPEYGCPRCDTVFEADMDRCLECGIRLPHKWTREAPPGAGDPPPLKGMFAMKAALASMGITANRARVGMRTWRFSPAFQDQTTRTQVDLTTDEHGDYLVLRAPVARLPLEGSEHLFRHLLTLNDEAAGRYRLSVFDNTVYMSSFEPIGGVDAATFPTTVSEFTGALARFQSVLEASFGAEPAFEHEQD